MKEFELQLQPCETFFPYTLAANLPYHGSWYRGLVSHAWGVCESSSMTAQHLSALKDPRPILPIPEPKSNLGCDIHITSSTAGCNLDEIGSIIFHQAWIEVIFGGFPFLNYETRGEFCQWVRQEFRKKKRDSWQQICEILWWTPSVCGNSQMIEPSKWLYLAILTVETPQLPPCCGPKVNKLWL